MDGIYTSAKKYLFEDERQDGTFLIPNTEDEAEEAKIEKFTHEIQKNWGAGESQLRTAIYVSFVKE